MLSAAGGALMVCGTGSGVGKSRIVAGLCRVLAREGIGVAPFKAQNMSLNSYVTSEGGEIGRAQAFQARAAGVDPEVAMNPVLLKPTAAHKSQVIVMGKPVGEQDALAYQMAKSGLFALVQEALADLRQRHRVVVLEGAGGIAEINLLESDIVNLRLAQAAGIRAVVVGDIERGGVFAALYGSVALLPEDLRAVLGGFVINKFRGEAALLSSGIAQIEARTGLPCFGVLPYLEELSLEAEDELDGLGSTRPAFPSDPEADLLDVAVIALPHLSNATDFDALGVEPGVALRFVAHASLLGRPDLIVLPGSKCTVEDLAWIRTQGLDGAIARAQQRGSALLGICAGYQMLGRAISDDVESHVGEVAGLGYLDCATVFSEEKWTAQRRGMTPEGVALFGYEIRHGEVRASAALSPLILASDGLGACPSEGAADRARRIYATSWHGLFDNDEFRRAFLSQIAQGAEKSFLAGEVTFSSYRDAAIDRLADACSASLDLPRLFALLAPAPVREVPERR